MRLIRISQVEKQLHPLHIESSEPPDYDRHWTTWHQRTKTDMTLAGKLYQRIFLTNDSLLLAEYTDTTIPTHETATQVRTGEFTQEIAPNVELLYSTTRSRFIESITFPKGIYQSVTWGYVDAEGMVFLSQTEMIGLTDTAHGMGREDADSQAVAVKVQLTGIDSSIIEYTYPLI